MISATCIMWGLASGAIGARIALDKGWGLCRALLMGQAIYWLGVFTVATLRGFT